MGLFLTLRADDSLMNSFQKGDSAAFNELYGRHKDRLYRFLLRSAPSAALAEELAQETWTSVIKRASQFQAKGHFKTWLFTIARNKLIDYSRSQAKKLDDAQNPEAEIEASADKHSSPEKAYELTQILQAIQTLPNEQRETFLLKEEGFSLREIAELTQTEAETVKSRLRYARKRLHASLSDSGELAL